MARLEQVSGPEEKMVFEVQSDTFLTLDMDSQVLGNVVLETPEGKEPMPPPEKGIFYIVSMPVAMALRRPDLLSPGRVKREAGRIVGCYSLTKTSGDIQGCNNWS